MSRGEIEGILDAGLDWDLVFALARRHRMLPFLYQHLRPVDEHRLPVACRDQLKAAYERNAACNLLMAAALVRLVKALEHEGIEVIAFKGPLTSSVLYGDLGLRSFTDIDLIVRGQDVAQAASVLTARGLFPEVKLSSRQVQALVRFRNEASFSAPDGSLHVDLHWRLLVSHFRMLARDEAIWERAATQNLAGVPIHTLSPVDLLRYFCARAAVDSWLSLYRICDVAEAARVLSPRDLLEAVDAAREVGKQRMIMTALLLAHDLLELPLPATVEHHARSTPSVARAVARATEHLFELARPEPSLLRRDIELLALLDHPLHRVEFALFLPLCPGPYDIRLVSLPRPLWFLYRLIRLVRASIKWTSMVGYGAWGRMAARRMAQAGSGDSQGKENAR